MWTRDTTSQVIAFRDKRGPNWANVWSSAAWRVHQKGTVRLRNPDTDSRNAAQAVTLLETIAEHGFDACIGGARVVTRKSACEGTHFLLPRRFWPMGSESATPRTLVDLQRAHSQRRKHARIPDFQLDGNGHLAIHRARNLELPPFTTRTSAKTDLSAAALIVSVMPITPPLTDEERASVRKRTVRFRTVGDMTCTSPVCPTPTPWKNFSRNRRNHHHRTWRATGRPDLD